MGGAGHAWSGTVTGTAARLRILDGFDGEVLADVPAASLHEDAPLYDRPLRRARRPGRAPGRRRRRACRRRTTAGADLLDLLVRHRRGCGRQYDHQLFLNTVEGPGGDATVLRLKHPTTGADTGRGPGPHHRRQPPLVRASTRAGARPWSWPRRC